MRTVWVVICEKNQVGAEVLKVPTHTMQISRFAEFPAVYRLEDPKTVSFDFIPKNAPRFRCDVDIDGKRSDACEGFHLKAFSTKSAAETWSRLSPQER